MEELSPQAEQALRAGLLPEQVHTEVLTRYAFASDASLYWYVPQAVVFPRTIADVLHLFAWSRSYKVPLTFRAAGTSLSGQAVTEGVLVEVRRYWQRWEILDGGRRIRSQPGVRAGVLNEHLRPYWRRLGPDPASVAVCTIGGIVANNASGMCCGTRQTAYRTLDSLVLVLPNGLVLDTALPEADRLLWEHSPELAEGLLRIRQHILSSPGLSERIRRKYQLKNTVGYSLNAFLDYDAPAQILAHLMVGSEGTLGFLAEIVLRTVPDPPLRVTGFALFPTPEAACQTVIQLRELGADAVEILDAASLRSFCSSANMELPPLPPTATALLFEYQRFAWSELQECQRETTIALRSVPLLQPLLLTSEGAPQLWEARRSLYPAVAARRPPGTTPISEDIAVPLEALAETLTQLRHLLQRHGYADAVIFGHAKDGNLHFVLPQPLMGPEDTERYAAFIDEIVALVLSHGGSLKAEHGTGRNMAPFVRTEWGDEAYELMWQLKQLIDPDGILNPDVILSRRERIHIQQLKQLPITGSEVDRCMECGFCEPVCPSRSLTLTPRQRLVLLRRASSLSHHLWRYALLDTCATDSLCHLHCPIGIDTGEVVRTLRRQLPPTVMHRGAGFLAQHFAAVDTAVRLLLLTGRSAARLVGAERFQTISARLHRWSNGRLPLWQPTLRSPLPRWSAGLATEGASTVLFPSCPSRWAGSPELLLLPEVARRAGLELQWFPAAERFCCGLLFASKGLPQAAAIALKHFQDALTRLRPQTLVVEGSSCTQWLKSHTAAGTPTIVDSTEFLVQLLPHLSLPHRRPAILLHIPCSARLMGTTEHLRRLAHACAEQVLSASTAECCGAAGDRWLFLPELAQSAIQHIVQAWRSLSADLPPEGYSSNPPCEMALECFTGLRWRSLSSLLVWAVGLAAPQNPTE